ncbi:MAG: 3-deoxy-manno-octulosonate cytidylyltransferase [Planctomycetota bacterium]
MPLPKILRSPAELAEKLAPLRAAGKKIVLANGAFEILHAGHVRYLEGAKAEGDVLVVAINSDESVARLKGPGRPLAPAAERAEILAALGCVDFVTEFPEDTADAMLCTLRPDVHAKGTDYEPGTVPERATDASLGIRVAIVGDQKRHATREIVARLREGRTGASPAGAGGLPFDPKRVAVVIPARWGSTRLPGKPLLKETGKFLIQHVVEAVRPSLYGRNVLVATDDQRIRAAVESFGARAVMTRAEHPSGTDRIAEAVAGLDLDAVVNVQGDEPDTDPGFLRRLLELLAEPGADISTLAAPIRDPADFLSPHVVKVVSDDRGFALYFSRAPVPHPREGGLPDPAPLAHLGLYAYRVTALREAVHRPVCALERAERLEQLRWLSSGLRIRVGEVGRAHRGIDTPADYAAFVARWNAR